MSFGFGVGDFLAVLKLANEVRKQFANAPKEFKDLSDDVENLSLALLNADFRVEDARSHGMPVERASPVLINCRALLLELQTFSNKHSELQRDTSDGTRAKFKRFWKRASWDSNEIRDFRQRLVSNVLMLNKLEQRNIHDDVKSLLRQQIQHRHSQIVDWISPIDFGKKHRDLLSERVDNISGTWILTTEQYATWIKSKGRTLFCWGMPGAGKTMATATVVDHLQSLCGGHGDIMVVYIYCRYQSQNQSDTQLLGSILRSLIRQCPKVPEAIEKLFNKYSSMGGTLARDEIMTAITTVLSAAKSKYIVIDAVDELEDHHRDILLRRLLDLQANTKVSLFLTSRQRPKSTTGTFNPMQDPLKNIVGGLQALGTPSKIEDLLLDLEVEIRATDRDVERYLRAEQNILLLPKCVKDRPQLQEEVFNYIVKVVDGMFLLAVLHLQSFKRKTTVKQVKDALQNMLEPSGSHAYDKAYDDALQRIESQAAELKDLAIRALSILMCARQLLSPDELCHALSADVIKQEMDSEDSPDMEDVLKSCAGLVTVDQESNCARLVHSSAQEYLDRNQAKKFPNALRYMAHVCSICSKLEPAEISDAPFYKYAQDNWWRHGEVVKAKELAKAEELAKKLHTDRIPGPAFEPPAEPSPSLPMPSGMDRFWQLLASKTSLMSVIQESCQTGDGGLLESFLDISQYQKSNSIIPLFMTAIQCRQDRIVKLLLDRGASPTRLAFITAVQNDDAECLQLLVERTPQQVIERHGSTLLLAASRLGHVSAMKYLVDLPGVDVTKTDDWNRNALHLASMSGHMEAVNLLLQILAASLSTVDKEGRTALHYAVMLNHAGITRLMLQQMADSVSIIDKEGRTALHYAIMRGYVGITELLLPEASSDILRADYDGFSPLDCAIMQDSPSLVKTLVESMLPGDPLRHQSAVLLYALSECHRFDTGVGRHRTPVPSNFHLPSVEILQTLLRSRQFDLNANDASGRTALHLAVAQPCWLDESGGSSRKAASSRLNLLLSMTDLDVNAGDNEGRTPLFYIWDAEMDAVRSYDIEEQEFIDQARTPSFDFWLNSWNKKREVQEAKVKMLIDAGADANRQRRGGRTILHDAALRTDQSSIGLLKILLRAPGIKTDIKDDDGQTPLSLATDKTRPLLLSAGASKESEG